MAEFLALEDSLDPGARLSILSSLIEQHPDAVVAPMSAQGLTVPLPWTLVLEGQQLSRSRTPVELVATPDLPAFVDAWERALTGGGARVPVRLADGGTALMHLVDVREAHGVLVCLIVAEGDAEVVSRLVARDAPTPRTCRVRKNEMAVIVGVDEAFTQLLGWSAESTVGTRSLALMHPDDQSRAIDHWLSVLAVPGSSGRWRGRHRRADGAWVWLEVTNHNRLDDPDHGDVLAEMTDISLEMQALEAVRERERLLATLAEALPSGVLQIDRERRVVYANARVHALIGLPVCPTVDEQFATVHPDNAATFTGGIDAVLSGVAVQLEVRVLLPGRRDVRECALTLRPLLDDHGACTGAVVCVDDVTESAELRRQLEHRATHDPLTDALNRRAVLDALDDMLARGRAGTAVVFVDLDGFKDVNDKFGHRAGDDLLVTVASRLRESTRAGDLVGRLGGDEFVVVAPDVADDGALRLLATRVSDALGVPAVVGGHVVVPHGSVGVAWSADPMVTAEKLLAVADRAMYEAKRSGARQPAVEVVGL